jgi:hypothetical protein
VDALQNFVEHQLDLPCWRAQAAALYFSAIFYSRPQEDRRIANEDFILSLWDRVMDMLREPAVALRREWQVTVPIGSTPPSAGRGRRPPEARP